MKNTKATIPDRLARLQEMKAMRAAGKTLAEIGAKYGISRERVRQIIGNTGKENRWKTNPLSRPADINSRAWYEKEDYGTRCIISGGEVLEI